MVEGKKLPLFQGCLFPRTMDFCFLRTYIQTKRFDEMWMAFDGCLLKSSCARVLQVLTAPVGLASAVRSPNGGQATAEYPYQASPRSLAVEHLLR